MDKIVARWDGWGGAPGFSNFYFSGTGDEAHLNDHADAVHDFFTGVVGELPNAVTITFQPTIQRITEADGTVIDEVAIGTVPSPVTGLGGANFSAPSGACITWLTADSVNGRRVKGRTFLVPLATAAYGPDGTLNDTILAEIRTAANALVARNTADANGKLVVWHRPVNGAGGSSHTVIAASVKDRAAMLTSRRT